MGHRTTLRLIFAALPLLQATAFATAQNIAASGANAVHVQGTNEIGAVDRGGPASAREMAAGHASQYAIGVADVIRVNVWKNLELSQTVTVDPDGFVSLPLLGDIHAAGLSANELGSMLMSKYSSFIVAPQVTVSVLEIRSRQVFVMGQVGKAGGYPLLSPLTVLQLIAQAGGLTPYAKRKAIYVLRASNGHTEKLPFNYVSVTRGQGQQNIVLEPGDTVIVP